MVSIAGLPVSGLGESEGYQRCCPIVRAQPSRAKAEGGQNVDPVLIIWDCRPNVMTWLGTFLSIASNGCLSGVSLLGVSELVASGSSLIWDYRHTLGYIRAFLTTHRNGASGVDWVMHRRVSATPCEKLATAAASVR